MSTSLKRESNKSNAVKSTGPKTKLGKKRASINAVKLGLYAKSRILPGEDRDAYRELAERVYDELEPTGPIEKFLADQIISNIWHLGRIDRAELAHLMKGADCFAVMRAASPPRPIGAEYAAGAVSCPIIRNATARDMYENGFRVPTKPEDIDGALAESMYDPRNAQTYPMIERLRRSKIRAITDYLANLRAIQERRFMLESASYPNHGTGSGNRSVPEIENTSRESNDRT